MLSQRGDLCRSLVTAFLTVAVSAAVIAQERIGTRNTDFGDVNRIMQEGSGARGFGYPSSGGSSQPQVDLRGIDQTTVKNLLRESVQESEILYKALQQDYRRYPEVRPLLSDLLTMRARASRLYQDLQDGLSLERLLPQFQQLDSDWRLLSHQMSQVRVLSSTSRDSIDRIDRLERQLEKLFRMEPQLDRRALLMELAQLSSSVRNLIQELETDMTGGNRLYELIEDARKLDQQAYRVQNMVYDQYTYAEIVSEYNRFVSQWTAMVPQLQQLQNRYVERSVRAIMLSDSELHNLLWLEQQTSRENLKQIAASLARDVDEFFNRVPLKLLLHFKDANQILGTADDFYGTVQNFQDCVKRNADARELNECYRYVEEYGVDFVRAFEPLRSQAGRVVLREIEDGVVALRNELNLAGSVTSIDTRKLTITAARLENLADYLDAEVRQWLNRERPTYSNQVLTASTRFVRRAQQIHRMLPAHPTANQLKQETSDLNEEFRALYQYLGRCNTEHRDHLRILSEDIAQAIYELRAPLQF